MSMTFEKAMEFTASVNCEGVYSTEALKALWYAANECPMLGNFVEVGCEFGRSTSLIAQAAKERHHYLVLIDPFVKHLDGSSGALVAQSLVSVLVGIDVEFALLRGPSYRVPYNFGPIALLHIDGNHSEAFLRCDMERFLAYVVDGGYICFHDYGNSEPYTKEVQAVVDELFLEPERYEDIGLFDTCKVFRKKGTYEDYYRKGRP